MMITNITLSVNPYAMKDFQAKRAMVRIMEIGAIVEKFQQEKRAISRTELEKFIRDNFDPNLYTSAKSILEWFELHNWVKTENRKEEYIKVKVWGKIYRDAYGNIIPETVKATLFDGQVVEIPNPACDGLRPQWDKVEKEIQVTRKYYTWVG